ncbi:MAG: hypothetical protein LBU61_01605 [Coriobacteriales bacterium]|nr:hypothetical protein [Coriobacteriales bacterium]
MKKSFRVPFGLIINLMFVFWPLGLLLLYLRQTSDKDDLMSSNKLQLYFGVCFIGVGLVGLSVFVLDPASAPYEALAFYLFICLFPLIGGVMSVFIWYLIRQRAKRYTRYLQVVESKVISIQAIADLSKQSVGTVTKDLQKMIELSFFSGARLDMTAGVLALPIPRFTIADYYQSLSSASIPVGHVMKCKKCTANSVIYNNQPAVCEYCGADLV